MSWFSVGHDVIWEVPKIGDTIPITRSTVFGVYVGVPLIWGATIGLSCIRPCFIVMTDILIVIIMYDYIVIMTP